LIRELTTGGKSSGFKTACAEGGFSKMFFVHPEWETCSFQKLENTAVRRRNGIPPQKFTTLSV